MSPPIAVLRRDEETLAFRPLDPPRAGAGAGAGAESGECGAGEVGGAVDAVDGEGGGILGRRVSSIRLVQR